jgi:hypothetical protein
MAYVILERMEKEEIDGMLFSVFICLFILLFGIIQSTLLIQYFNISYFGPPLPNNNLGEK